MSQIFQSFWFGGTLSPYEWLCMKSFIDHGHAYHLYSYDPQLLVPEGVQLLNAEAIAPASDVFFYSTGPGKGSVSSFSNLFRYELLLQQGNWWVDTDVLCMTAQVPAGAMFFALEAPDRANGAVMRFDPSDAIMRECRDRARSLGDQVTWGQTGPLLLTDTLARHGLLEAAAPAATCYPFDWNEVMLLFDPEQTAALHQRNSGAAFIHFWNEILRRAQVNKRMGVPPGCYLDDLFARHAVSFPSAPCYTTKEIQHLAKISAENTRIGRLEAALRQAEAEKTALAQTVAALRSSLDAVQARLNCGHAPPA